MKKIAILGSTGSIGTQTLDVVRTNKDIEVTALAAGSNISLLESQIREFTPKLAAVWDEKKAAELKSRVRDLDVKVVSGMEGLLEIAAEPSSEILVTAIVGMIGIRPTIAAMEAGKDIALANKETLVTAGHIIMPLAKEKNVRVLSPKKTIEGAVGGIIGAAVLGFIYASIFGHRMDEIGNPQAACAAACAIAAVISQIGDLAASAIKRNHNVKDYGHLIPGHGGVLDRFDSVIFTAPAIFFALTFLG